MIIVFALASLATSAQGARVRGGTDTGLGANINARNSMRSDDMARTMNYDASEYEGDINATADINADVQAGDNINYHDKTLHNYQDPYLTNHRAYKSNENGEAAPPPKSNNIIILSN
jgi:hypothetical protein